MTTVFVVQRRWPDELCVTGEMLIAGKHECYTLEPPIKTDGTKPRAIPPGTYELKIQPSRKFGRLMPFLQNVPDFEAVEIHWGSLPKDTTACTVVGDLVGKDFIGHSVDEFNRLFMKIYDALKLGPVYVQYIDPECAECVSQDSSGTLAGSNEPSSTPAA